MNQTQPFRPFRFIIVILILMATGFFVRSLNFAEETPPGKSFDTFPMKFSGWVGDESRFDEKVYEVLGVDDSILGTYRNENGDVVQIYVGYYQSQRKGDLIHSPKNCIPGSGWNITGTGIENVSGATSEDSFKAIKLLIENNGEKQVVLYWFQSRGRIISSEYMQKIYLVVDSIFKRRTDGSFVRLISMVSGDDTEATTERLKAFAHDIFPILQKYIPS